MVQKWQIWRALQDVLSMYADKVEGSYLSQHTHGHSNFVISLLIANLWLE